MDENHSEDNHRGQLPAADRAYILLYNKFKQLTVGRYVPASVYTSNKHSIYLQTVRRIYELVV